MIENEISLNIEKIIKDVLPDAKIKALTKIGVLVQNEAKKRCGVDTGVLRNSINYNVKDSSVEIGSNIEYAPFHHNHNKFLQEAINENIIKINKCFDELL